MLTESLNITSPSVASRELHEARISESIQHIVDQGNWSILKRQVTEDKIFEHFILLCSKEKLADFNLFGGFFCQVAAGYLTDSEKVNQLLNISYNFYGDFQKDNITNGDIGYFVQWQRGVIEEALGFDWGRVEKTLTDASGFYPARGEAFRHIIQHYRVTKQEGVAYIFSSIAKDMYYGNIPAESYWFTNHSFYNWKVLYYHASICKKNSKSRGTGPNFKTIKSLPGYASRIFYRGR